jgi:deoxyribose-phosphate aldolase
MKRNDLARKIDHTLLGPKATSEGVAKLCAEAAELGVASVCIDPSYVAAAHESLAGSGVIVCTVIGFPQGMTTPATKAFEAKEAIAHGADELDMVVNGAALRSGDEKAVLEDIRAVVDVARSAPRRITVKVILETASLTDDEKRLGARLAKKAGADYVKTSTGFGPGGATAEDVALLREVVGPKMGIKAAGGIRDYDTAVKMVAAGATRIGASRTIDILAGAEE